MKIAPPSQWNWRIFYVLILIALGYGYYSERMERLEREEIINELLIVHDAEMGDCINLINNMTRIRQQLDTQLIFSRDAIFEMQRTIYEMYNELRKYRKDLPPWGGEKPMDPDEDKWINNDT